MSIFEKLWKIIKPRSENIGLGVAILLSFIAFLVVLTFFTKATLPMANYITTNYGFGKVSFVEYASIAISSASLVTVVAILLQVRNQTRNIEVQEELAEKEERYLQNFEPKISVIQECQEFIVPPRNPNARITVVNPSQTAAVIENVRLSKYDYKVNVEARTPQGETESNLSNSIVLKPNEMKDLHMTVLDENNENPFTDEEKEEILEQDSLIMVLDGNFDAKLLQLPVTDSGRGKDTLKVQEI